MIIGSFCTALFSGVHKLTALYNIFSDDNGDCKFISKRGDDVTGHGHGTKQINVSVYDRCYMSLNMTIMTDVTWARTLLL